jgi:predicted metal-dependent phosphoesterase TrpH
LDLRPSTRWDLHLHSTRSDGRFDPDEVLLRCARAGLDVVALTDHDLPTGVAPGPRTLEGREIHVLAGAELSGTHQGREHHLLVYFPDAVPEGFAVFCAEQCRGRAQRYADAIARLGLEGLVGPDPAACRGEVSLTRHHLARQLVERGHVGHIREAFTKFLGDSHRLVPPIALSFEDAIRTARAFGGLTSWAHPPVTLLEPYLPAFVAAGLQGLEGLRPGVTSDDRRKYRSAARRFGLYLTGGSDWHGWSDDGDLGLFRVQREEIEPFVALLVGAPS